MKLEKIISNLIDDYNSIDLRTAAYKKDGAWHAALFTMRFRSEDVDDIIKAQSELLKEHGEIKEEEFCIQLTSLPTSHWEKIRSDWDKKFVCFSPEFTVNIKNLEEFSNEPAFHYFPNDAIFYNVKSFNTQHGGGEPINRILEKYNEQAQKLLFSDIYDYFSKIFQFSENQINGNYKNIIVIPIFLDINKVEFKETTVLIEYQTSYKNKLTFVLEIHQNQFAKNTLLRDKFPIDNPNGSIVRSFNTKKFLKNYFELKVFKNGVPIGEEQNEVRNNYPLMSEITNPIMPVFTNFISIKELKNNLFNLTAKKFQNESKVFERAISWLMNLVGFSTIWLDEYDQADGKDRPSFDLLAHEKPNRVFLINAKTKTITADLIDKEKRYRMKMEELFENKMEFFSILFTSRSTSLGDKASANQVNLLGREQLESIVGLLEKGELEKARKIITTIPSYPSSLGSVFVL